jgi:hypothetical protein
MRLLIGLLLLTLAVAGKIVGSCTCCENNQLVTSPHRCNPRLGRTFPILGMCMSTTVTQTQLVVVQEVVQVTIAPPGHGFGVGAPQTNNTGCVINFMGSLTAEGSFFGIPLLLATPMNSSCAIMYDSTTGILLLPNVDVVINSTITLLEVSMCDIATLTFSVMHIFSNDTINFEEFVTIGTLPISGIGQSLSAFTIILSGGILNGFQIQVAGCAMVSLMYDISFNVITSNSTDV